MTKDLEEAGTSRAGTILRVVAIVAILGVILALMAFNTPKTQTTDEVWDERTTVGNKDAKHHFVMYTDIMCPYCDYFSRAIMKDQDKFDEYIAENDILFEVRVTDFLYEYNGVSSYSQDSAEAAECATREGKFWEFYHAALTALDEDYHSKGIANSKSSPMITDMTRDYWMEIGHEVGLGESFDDCYKKHEALADVQKKTKDTAKAMEKSNIAGLPFFAFEKFVQSGFDTSWGWEYVKTYFDLGLGRE